MKNHTNGPWSIRESEWYGPESAITIQGPEAADGSCQMIAGAVMCPEKRANAQLIAASPDLLLACEFALSEFNSVMSPEMVRQFGATRLIVQKAIAKAKGEDL